MLMESSGASEIRWFLDSTGDRRSYGRCGGACTSRTDLVGNTPMRNQFKTMSSLRQLRYSLVYLLSADGTGKDGLEVDAARGFSKPLNLSVLLGASVLN